MNNINKLSKAIAASLGTVALLGTLPVSAETVQINASVTVLNTFTLAQTTPLSFGTVRAKASTDNANTANIVLPPASGASATSGTTVGADNTDVPTMSTLTAGAQGVYAVSSAAAFTPLNFSVSSNSVSLTLASAPPTSPNAFTLSALRAVDGSGNEIPLVDSGVADGNTLTTDVNGALAFTVGGTLSTQDHASRAFTNGNYTDGAYSGSLTLTVDY